MLKDKPTGEFKMQTIAEQEARKISCEKDRIIKNSIDRLNITPDEYSRFSMIVTGGTEQIMLDGIPFITFYNPTVSKSGDFEIRTSFKYRIHQ